VKFSIIIPDRCDRKELTEHCFFQMDRQTLKPERIYHINYIPLDGEIDLTQRIIKGIDQSERDGIDKCFVVENDDYYPDDYFEKMQFDCDMIGSEKTVYYNLKFKRLKFINHIGRSSLFCTGFRISKIKNFVFPLKNLDIRLWLFAQNLKVKFIETGAIGIKHGIGLCGGIGHQFNASFVKDSSMVWLQQNTREESFEFYKSYHKKINESINCKSLA